MKSSDAVFTRQNPFRPKSPLGKTHYHPSCIQSLSKTKKKTSLSPVRLNQQGRPQAHTVGQETQQEFDKLDGQCTISESWPANNCRLSPDSDMVLSAMEPQKLSVAPRNTTESSDQDILEESLLARYIEHFRHGRAQSREDRQQLVSATGEEQRPPWHISPSLLPSSSSPTKSSEKDAVVAVKDDHLSLAEHCQHDSTPSPCRGSLSILSDMSSWEFDDSEIQHLQEKASRLLQRSDWPVSDVSAPVSPDGLGCSDCSSSLSVDEPVERPFISSNFPKKSAAGTVKPRSVSIQAGSNSKSSAIPSLVPPTRPEEDILFQWRLRRKMEQAREWPQSHQQASTYGSTFSLQGPSQHHPSASGQRSKQDFQPPESSKPQIKETLGPCPPASSHPPFPAFVVSDFSVSQPQTVVHVPPHMHFLCDVLPCPIQSSRLVVQERISQRSDECPARTVPKKTPVTDTDEHISKPTTPPTPASSGGVEEQQPSHQKRAEKDKNMKAQSKETEKDEKMLTSIRKQKKSSRCTVELTGVQKLSNKSSSHHTATKKAKPRTEQHQKEKCNRFSSGICSRDDAPPSSPVCSALGQVVSEVLFASVDTAPTHNTPVTSPSPVCAASAPSQPSASPNDTQNSMEVISQLLQEAEDSDEKEFESDPLLQVLRKQRKRVKEQISDVNSLLEEQAA